MCVPDASSRGSCGVCGGSLRRACEALGVSPSTLHPRPGGERPYGFTPQTLMRSSESVPHMQEARAGSIRCRLQRCAAAATPQRPRLPDESPAQTREMGQQAVTTRPVRLISKSKNRARSFGGSASSIFRTAAASSGDLQTISRNPPLPAPTIRAP